MALSRLCAVGLVVLTGVSLCTGCREEGDAAGPRDLAFADLKAGDAVIRVNGENITWKEMCDWLEMEYRNLVLRNRSAGVSPADEKFTQFRRWRLQRLGAEMTHTKLISQAARRQGVMPGQDLIERVEDEYVKSYRDVAGLGTVSNVQQVACALRLEEGYVRDSLREVATRKAYLASKDPLVGGVPADELAARQSRIARINADAQLSNAVQRATIDRVLKLTREGMDFAEAGEKFGELSKSNAKHWLSSASYSHLERQGVDRDPTFAHWAFTAPVGSVGGPFELRDGTAIVKILGRTEGALRQSMAATKLAKASVVRILFKAYTPVPVSTDAELTRKIMDFHERKAMDEELGRLIAEADISYPCGTNLFRRLPEEFSRPTPELFDVK